MKISNKLKGLFFTCLGVFAFYYVAEWQMQKKIVDFLNRKVPEHIHLSYESLQINLLKGNISFKEVSINAEGKQTSSCEINILANEVDIDGFNYWSFFFKDAIVVKDIILSQPDFNFKTCPNETPDNTNITNRINLLKSIEIDRLELNSGKIHIWDTEAQQEILAVEKMQLVLHEITTDSERINTYIPFEHAYYDFEFYDVYGPLGKFETFKMDTLNVDSTSVKIKDFQLSTKYTKKELSTKIDRERDHMMLNIPSVEVLGHAYQIQDEKVQFNFGQINITNPNFEIYRDKSIPDNFESRSLYAKLLRDLPTKFTIGEIAIDSGTFIYEENAPNNVAAGELTFESLDASIKNIGNYENENVSIAIQTHLMGSGLMEMDWQFNVGDTSDAFIVKGELSSFDTATLNRFLEPNLRVETVGLIHQMYFTISGDNHIAHGDIKMNYDNFRFKVMNKERNHTKKILSFIGNLFINNGSKADAEGYRYGQIEVERPRNKSFFNYLWVGLEDGLIDVLTGSGKKED